jgi:hypothetical protein
VVLVPLRVHPHGYVAAEDEGYSELPQLEKKA